MRFVLIFLFAAALAAPSLAQEKEQATGVEWGPPHYVNPSYVSANKRHWVVLRMYPGIGDFEWVRVDVYEAMKQEAPPGATVAAVYAWTDTGMQLMSTWELMSKADHLLVSDAGDRVVAVGRYTNPRHRWEGDLLLAIHDGNGHVVRSLMPADVFSAEELATLKRDWDMLGVSIDGEHVLVHVGNKGVTVRVRISDGAVLEPARKRVPDRPRKMPEAARPDGGGR